MHANCSSLLSRLKCTCMCACVCVCTGGASVWSEGGHVENEISVCSAPCLISELLWTREPRSWRKDACVRTHVRTHVHTHTHSERCRKWEHYGTIWYSWHANKHTTVCHPLSPEQINNREKSIPIRILLLCPACGCRWIDTESPLLTCRYS